jgi:hypothetical protein
MLTCSGRKSLNHVVHSVLVLAVPKPILEV